ncbi:MAG TPA: hypothetical protein VOA00_06565 [Thermoanaerobaculia bacterium]|nr:hypothetical protein [Thermoanaerobaculia bacterium]
MKKSASIRLTLVVSMTLVSCGQGRRCADPTGRIVPDSMCSGPAVLPGYHWVAAGRSAVTGGRIYSGRGTSGTSGTSSGVSRGGFGAHGSSGVGA